MSILPAELREFAYGDPMKILVIEDDREAADYLQKALSEAGHNVHVAGDGDTGFTLADTGDYDVMVVDRMLPRRDGLSVIAGLRSRGNSTPVLILSALGDVDLVVVFGEDTPLDLIRALRPDVLVKGADYTVDTVVGAKEVQGWGGRVVLAELTEGQSTTGTIARMK